MKKIKEAGVGKMNMDIIDPTKTPIPTLSSKVMFWRPKYLVESKWLEHIPFYFWLVEAQQPELVFEPEITSGVTYFSICQAVDKLNLDTQCIATTNQESNLLPKINQYNYENYREFSVIDSEGAKETLLDLPDNSIDILVLKDSHSFIYDKKQMDRWQAKLSDRAVVLIHGTQNKKMKLLCRNLKETYKTIEFVHSGGLLVVSFGYHQSPVMSSFFQQNNFLSSKRLIQNIYSRLGNACSESWLNETLGQRMGEMEGQIEQTNHKNTELSNVNISLNKSVKDKSLEIESINQTYLDVLAASKGKDEILKKKEYEVSQVNIEQTRLLENNKKIKLKEQSATKENKQTRKSLELRFEEISALTKILHESDSKVEKLAKVDSSRQIALETLKADSKLANDKLSKQITLSQKNDREIFDLKSANALLVKENTNLRSNYSNQTALLFEKDNKVSVLQKEISSLKVNNSLLESDQVATASIIEGYKLKAIKAEQSLTDRFNELAVLTSMLRDQELAAEIVTKVNIAEKTRSISISSVISKIKYRNKKKRSAEKNLQRQILIIQESNLFDSDWYQEQYPETKKYKGCAIRHFLEVGGKAGLNPSPEFNSEWYFGTHPDVAEAGVNPLVHYIEFGKFEGREVVSV